MKKIFRIAYQVLKGYFLGISLFSGLALMFTVYPLIVAGLPDIKYIELMPLAYIIVLLIWWGVLAKKVITVFFGFETISLFIIMVPTGLITMSIQLHQLFGWPLWGGLVILPAIFITMVMIAFILVLYLKSKKGKKN